MENVNPGISCSFYTVKQLAALFGKSEDTIRRWKNEGVGREEDNIKLRAVEREDGRGRKNARHLVFSREAVIEFVKANPFLMDDAPQLSLMMQAEGAWTGGAIPMPGAVGAYSEPDEDSFGDEFLSRFTQRGKGSVLVREDEEQSEDKRPVIERRSRPDARRFAFNELIDENEDEIEDEYEEEEEVPGRGRFDPFDPFEARERAGFGNAPHQTPRSRRSAENQKRREMLLYVMYVLKSHMGELEDELYDVGSTLRELNISGFSQRGADTMRRMLSSRREELSKKIGYISDFVELLEEE